MCNFEKGDKNHGVEGQKGGQKSRSSKKIVAKTLLNATFFV